jgi:hypothetical protein
MQHAYHTHRNPDVALSHLSYWTDNGAYYYMYSALAPDGGVCDQLAHGPMDEVIESLVASWQETKLPVRSIQLDDWWYVGGTDTPLQQKSHDHMCVADLKGKPGLWGGAGGGGGIPPLPKGMGYTLYGPFFCPDSVYSKNTSYGMVNSTDGYNAAPGPGTAEAFFSALFAGQLASGVPLTGYEVDFLQDQTTWFEYMVTEHDGAANWLSGMANAAASHNVSVQYCMAHPGAFLHALSLPAVTNGRASVDYQTPSGNLLTYGTDAPFFAAVGIAPSKDNLWSTPRQPRPRDLRPSTGGPPPCDGGSRNVTNTFLHALVATLSTGPVGFSDAVGHTNASLVLRTCDASGLLLKPSAPLAAIDRSFSRRSWTANLTAFGGPVVPSSSHVWATHTSINGSNWTWYFALSLVQEGALQPFELVRSDLWPVLAPAENVVAWNYQDPKGSAKLIPGASASPSPSTQSAPLVTMEGDGHAYWILAPVMPGGWSFFGETSKLTPVSVQREFSFSFSQGGSLTVRMRGAAGETCTMSAWKAGQLFAQTTVIDATGSGEVSF